MPTASNTQIVDQIVANARKAQAAFELNVTQERYDRAALAVGWAIMQPERNLEMATLAVETTGLGNVADTQGRCSYAIQPFGRWMDDLGCA